MSAAKRGEKVVVGLSGGVDSAVAAALLKEQGYQVIGVRLHLWDGFPHPEEPRIQEASKPASRIADALEIPFLVIDARSNFRTWVVDPFVDGYTNGITPNPCLRCNQFIRWGFLLEKAQEMGASYLATGHYARLQPTSEGKVQLLKGLDQKKDQSYFLSFLDQEALRQTLFPLGELRKEEVRMIASDLCLPAADRPDSQDLCFPGVNDYRDFLRQEAPESFQPGPILNIQGEKLGTHTGLANFTIGQRKGLGISPPNPHYVIGKDLCQNALIVGPAEFLGQDQLTADSVNWISGAAPQAPFSALVKIRYQASARKASIITKGPTTIQVNFHSPLRDITPGQAAVLYQEDVCLGGGIIQKKLR